MTEQELRELMQHVTPGPWAVDVRASMRVVGMGERGVASTGGFQTTAQSDGGHNENLANARYIAACSPDAILALLDANAQKDAIRRKQDAAFAPYLKDGETPIERLKRERKDNDTLLGLLAVEREARLQAERRYEVVAVGMGYGEYPEGQGGAQVADPDVIVNEWKRSDRELAAEREARVQAERERDDLRAHMVMTEHRGALSLLGRSSEQEARENDLREKLAVAELALAAEREAKAQAERERDGIKSAHDAVTRAIAEAVGEGDPSGPYWEDGVAFLRQMLDAERTAHAQTREALRWLTNVACGVGKAGGAPERDEWPDAIDAAKAALSGATEDQ
jgi:hypothetical protein